MKSTRCSTTKVCSLLVSLSLSIASFTFMSVAVAAASDSVNIDTQSFIGINGDCDAKKDNLKPAYKVKDLTECAQACHDMAQCAGFSFNSDSNICALKANGPGISLDQDNKTEKCNSIIPPVANSNRSKDGFRFYPKIETMESIDEWSASLSAPIPTAPKPAAQSIPLSAKMDVTPANRADTFTQPYALYLNNAVVGRASYGIGCKAGSNGDYNCVAVNYDSCWIGTYNVNTKKWVKNWAKDLATCTGIDNDFTKSKAAIDASTIKAFDSNVTAAPAGYARNMQGDCNGSDLGDGLSVANAAECAKNCSSYSGNKCLGFSLDTRLASGKYRCVLKSIRGCSQKTDNLYQFFYKQLEVQSVQEL